VVRYQIVINDQFGERLHTIAVNDQHSFSMTVAENEIGELITTTPQTNILWDLVNVPDRILTLERDVGRGFEVECGPGAERGFFLRDVEFSTDSNNKDYCVLYAYDGNYLLDSRLVAYTGDNSYTKRTDQTDDICLLIVREKLGAECLVEARKLARLSVAEGRGNGPTVTKTYSKANVLATLKDMAALSWEMGTYLVFDTVYTGPGTFEFRVYLNYRGTNMGGTQPTKCNVKPWPCTMRYARKDERNYIYAGGKGEGDDQTVEDAFNATWTGASIWNRREAWANAPNTEDTAAILAAAKAMLYHSRPRWVLEGELQDVDGQRYGIDYHWGDVVSAKYKTSSIDVHIAAVNIEYVAGKETVNVSVRSEP
jgi:hypothetical protein